MNNLSSNPTNTKIVFGFHNGNEKHGFEKEFFLKFAPYLGLNFKDSNGERFMIIPLVNNDKVTTSITYDAGRDFFTILVICFIGDNETFANTIESCVSLNWKEFNDDSLNN